MKTTVHPEEIGFSAARLAKVFASIESWVETGFAHGAAIGLARCGTHLVPRGFGRMAPRPGAPALPADAIFLTASVTKPVTCAAVMLLVEREQVELGTPVVSIIPEFGTQGKDRVALHHLLTHTSGLLDMIPENIEYRKRHAPLDMFIERICELDLLFEPGTNISYQSAGIAILGEIVKRIAGVPLPEFLRREVFEPLGMNDTALGVRPEMLPRIPEIWLSDDLIDEDWNWNKPYWREFGAPWGGMFSTVRDMSVFCQTFLHGGTYNGVRVFDPATIRAMTTNQTLPMPDIPEDVKQRQAWGLGWRLNRPQATFGIDERPSPRTFGHYGATGTVVWADPDTGLSCALFTTQPSLCESVEFHQCAEMIMEAVEEEQ